MKKLMGIILITAILFSLCACGHDAKWDEAADALRDAAGIECTVEITKGRNLDVTVNIPESDDFAHFGIRVYKIISAAGEMFRDESDFTLKVNKETSIQKYRGKDYVYVTASGNDNYFCHYFDNRTNALSDSQQKDCKTVDDLAKLFPSLKIRLQEERNLTPEEFTIYREVWDALDAAPEKDEMEIFNELAPRYNMTGGELSDYIYELMGKVYF